MKQKTDSLQNELHASEFDLANFKDTNLGIYTKKDNLTDLRLQGKIRMLYVGLGKALENLEIADFSLKYQTPFIQTIDAPVLPLSPIQTSLLIQIIKAMLLGGFVGGGFIIGRKIYNEAMNS